MLAHLVPFFRGELPFLFQDMIRDAHFANIVEQYPAIYVEHLGVHDLNIPWQADDQFRDASSMTLVFTITELEGARPAFQCRVVGLDQFLVGALQVLEELRTVDGDGSLSWQCMQKLHPIGGGRERRAMEDLKYALDLTFHDQGNTNISHEPFPPN